MNQSKINPSEINKNTKILVVEDESTDLKDLKERLSVEGYVVYTAIDSKTAIKIVIDKHPDLILISVDLNGISGYEVCRILKEDSITKDVPIILNIASSNTQLIEKVNEVGFADCISTKFDSIDFLSIIKTQITQSLKVKESIRESEERFQYLADASMEAIFFSKNGICLDVNQVAIDMFRLNNRSDIIGRAVKELLTEESWEKVRKNVLNNTTEAYEAFGKKMDGKEFPISVRAKSMPYKNEGIVRVTSVLDITERKDSEKKVQESEEKYRSLFTSANDAIFLMDKNKFITCNPKTLEMFDCNEKEIIGQCPSLFSPELQPDGQLSSKKSEERINLTLAGKPQRFEWVHIQKNGTPFNAEVSLNRMILSGIVYIHAVVRNITERIKMENALRDSEEKYRTFFENNYAIILLVDPDNGEIIFANKSAVNFYGYNKDQLIGMNMSDLIALSPDEIVKIRNKARKIKHNSFTLKHKLSSGQIRDVVVYQTKLLLNKKEVFSVIIYDVTERMQTEEKLLQNNKELQIFYNAAVGRELKVIELKKEINSMLEAEGKRPKYKIPE